MMNYTIMFIFIVLLTIISLYIVDSYKPRSYCLAKDIYINRKDIKLAPKTKRRYFKPTNKQFAFQLLFNYFVVIIILLIMFFIYLKSDYFFNYNNFLEVLSEHSFNYIVNFIFFLIMIMSPVLVIIITVRTILLLMDAYTTIIKLEKNHLLYNNKFKTINIFYNKDKHKVTIEKGYIKGIFGNKTNVLYYKLVFDFKNEKRELKLYGFKENDIIDLKNSIF